MQLERLTPEVYENRGLARALTGDLQGAAEDLRGDGEKKASPTASSTHPSYNARIDPPAGYPAEPL